MIEPTTQPWRPGHGAGAVLLGVGMLRLSKTNPPAPTSSAACKSTTASR